MVDKREPILQSACYNSKRILYSVEIWSQTKNVVPLCRNSIIDVSAKQFRHNVYNQTPTKMARPIRNTPTLYGKDAERFLAEIAVLPSREERKKERERIERNVEEFMSLIAKDRSSSKEVWI